MRHLSGGPDPGPPGALSGGPAGPRGGDWVSGERVFGPPRGTVEADWFVPLVLEAHPGTPHERALAAVRSAWAVVREEAALDGVGVAEVDETAVRRRLDLPADTAEVGAGEQPVDPVLVTALRVVLAAGRAYGG